MKCLLHLCNVVILWILTVIGYNLIVLQEFQQHDVQELNRILFGAIESSLLGTSGEKLIANLYHGSSVQQVRGRGITVAVAQWLSTDHFRVHLDVHTL